MMTNSNIRIPHGIESVKPEELDLDTLNSIIATAENSSCSEEKDECAEILKHIRISDLYEVFRFNDISSINDLYESRNYRVYDYFNTMLEDFIRKELHNRKEEYAEYSSNDVIISAAANNQDPLLEQSLVDELTDKFKFRKFDYFVNHLDKEGRFEYFRNVVSNQLRDRIRRFREKGSYVRICSLDDSIYDDSDNKTTYMDKIPDDKFSSARERKEKDHAVNLFAYASAQILKDNPLHLLLFFKAMKGKENWDEFRQSVISHGPQEYWEEIVKEYTALKNLHLDLSSYSFNPEMTGVQLSKTLNKVKMKVQREIRCCYRTDRYYTVYESRIEAMETYLRLHGISIPEEFPVI